MISSAFDLLKLVSTCHFRADGVGCYNGTLRMPATGEQLMVEGEPVDCPACGGRGKLLTDDGRQVLELLATFGRPILLDLVREILEEQERH